MDELIHRIEEKLSVKGKRLSAVSNPDGFLKRSDTQQMVLENCGLLLLPVTSSLELRIRYELYDKESFDRVCYIIDDLSMILPDMEQLMHMVPVFSISELFPACNSSELLRAKLSFAGASYIFNKRFVFNLSAEETKRVMDNAQILYGQTADEYINQLNIISLKWDNINTIDGISNIILKAIKQGIYENIEWKINEINDAFQKYIDTNYFGMISSSHIVKPKVVHKILPHLAYKYARTDKIALVVIDGMSYWQYLILDQKLENNGLKINKDFTLSWLPSITKLSRQAIFRGNIPHDDYNQSPDAETKLWKAFWQDKNKAAKRMQEYEIAYTHDSLLAEDSSRYKQAFVDVSLDHKMHSSSNNLDLYSLTENWSKETAENIILLHNQGYTVVITTDHGNILAHSWRALNSQERTFLYEKESRGSRHLIYSKKDYLNGFLHSNPEINKELLVCDRWAIWRNSKCFKGQNEITHGGSHFLEVVIPFITIEKS